MWNCKVLITEKLWIKTVIHHNPTVILQNTILRFVSNFNLSGILFFIYIHTDILRRILYNVHDFIRYNKHCAHNFIIKSIRKIIMTVMTIIIKTNYQAKHVCFSTFVIIMNQTTLLNSRIQFIVPKYLYYSKLSTSRLQFIRRYQLHLLENYLPKKEWVYSSKIQMVKLIYNRYILYSCTRR